MPKSRKAEIIPIEKLRQQWSEAWRIQPHVRIGRTMLEKSLAYKQRELAGLGMTNEQRERLKQLVKTYKRNPKCFDDHRPNIKPGTRLVKEYGGQRHVITVLKSGFEYQGNTYTSLTQLATEISGTPWNGWAFFGLRRKKGVT